MVKCISRWAVCLQEMGDEQPMPLLPTVRGLELEPDNAAALRALGGLLHRAGNLDAAADHLARAIALVPEAAAGQFALGLVRRDQGLLTETLAALRQALALAPEKDSYWAVFAESLRLVRVESFDAGLKQDLLRCFAQPGVEHQNLAIAAQSLLRCDPALAPLFTWRGGAPGEAVLAALVDPLLQSLLQHCIVPDPDFERLMTGLRAALLERALAQGAGLAGVEPFCGALAAQCFLNEYLYAETPAEREKVHALRGRLAAPPPDPGRLAVLACYRPLHDIPEIDLHKADAPWMAALLQQQAREPAREAELAAGLPQLKPPADHVSQAVQAQYESNPYPRWASLNRGTPRPLEAVMGHLFPGLAEPDGGWPAAPRVLIAGCGTGRHALMSAQLYAGAEVLAVDLSRASLAYAQRKAEELGIGNVTFLQADILDLGELEAGFDVIECSGVLHHMAEPLAGWRVLRGLMAPGGVMKVALYSEAARQHIVAARDFIAAGGYGSSAEEIRRCRQAILASGDPLLQKVAAGRDFYSLSLCRDLIFHAQEHRFTLPQIGAALEKLNLELIGFECQDPNLRRAYLSLLPRRPGHDQFCKPGPVRSRKPGCLRRDVPVLAAREGGLRPTPNPASPARGPRAFPRCGCL